MTKSASDPEVDEESPDVGELFRHYDKLYFRGALVTAGFAVEWTSPRVKTSRAKEKKGYHMVHCWQKLKEASKWKLSYASYKEAVKNGKAKDLVDGEDEAPGENAHVHRPRGQKASKADLAREASAFAMANALKTIIANSQEATAAMYEKRRLDKEATAAMYEKRRLDKEATAAAYINLTKEAIEIRRMDIEAKRLDAEAKKLAEETRIMLADLSNMNPEQRELILKRQAEIRAREP